MPTLGEVLGSVLAETLKGRAAADAMTRSLVAQYRQDPILSMLSVPSITISEMKVTLRFAVRTFDLGDPAFGGAASAWSGVLTDRVLPRLIEERKASLAGEDLSTFRSAVAAERVQVPEDVVVSALKGDVKGLLDASVLAVMDRVREAPVALRRRVGSLPDLQKAVRRGVQAELEAFLVDQRATADAGAVLNSRLEVAVEQDALGTAPDVAIQEVSVTLSMNEIETLIAGSPEPA